MCGLLIVLVSCSTLKISQNVHKSNWTSIDSLFAVKAPLRLVEKGESQGSLVYQKDTFQYRYSHDQTFGPTTVRHEFMDAFRGNYYYKFFEYIHFDTRFHRKYRDSVQLMQIDMSACDQQTSLYECQACNACAKLKFKDRIHNFSFIMDTKIATQPYVIQLDTLDHIEIKTYYNTIDQKDRGLVYTQLAKDQYFISLGIKPIGEKPNITFESLKLMIGILKNRN